MLYDLVWNALCLLYNLALRDALCMMDLMVNHCCIEIATHSCNLASSEERPSFKSCRLDRLDHLTRHASKLLFWDCICFYLKELVLVLNVLFDKISMKYGHLDLFCFHFIPQFVSLLSKMVKFLAKFQNQKQKQKQTFKRYIF